MAPRPVSDRSSQRLYDAPASLDPLEQNQPFDADDLRPFGQGQRLSVVSEATIAPGVVGLFSLAGPSHIPRLIPAAVVDTVNGQPWRTWANVAEESLEGVPPLRAYSDAAATVAGICLVPGIQTSPLDAIPCLVFTGFASAMRGLDGGGDLSAQASATLSLPAHEIFRFGGHEVSAVASAFPDPAGSAPYSWTGYHSERDQASESLSFEPMHGGIIIEVG